MELTELKQKYDRELNFITRSDKTKTQYNSVLNKFLRDNNRVYRMSVEELKNYLSDFRNKYSDSYFNVMGSVMKILYTKVLNQPQKMTWFKAVKTRPTYHDIMSNSEFIQMVKNRSNIKHKLIIFILFSTGIRESELINLKLSDINYVENSIFIRSLKKGKNRNVALHQLTKRYLLAYIKKCNPKEYVLNGQKSLQYSVSSIQTIVKEASSGKYSPHDFRHVYSTLIIEKEGVFTAKELLGHESLNSTLFYNHIPKSKLATMYNPLDSIAI